MANLHILNEFGLSPEVLSVELDESCRCSCTWCYKELSRRHQWGGRQRRGLDEGTFERTVERAFGPEYDPHDFRSWAVRNRVPLVYSAGAEPFQDIVRGRAVLGIARRLDLPLVIQTRGLNWREVWDDLRALAGNVQVYVSLPTLDDRVLKRFEPGTPPAAERVALLEACRDAGIPTILAIAPYHQDWDPDPAGLARRAIEDWGIPHIFLDVLRLTRKQASVATDPVMVELAGTLCRETVADRFHAVRDLCFDAEAGFTMVEPWAAVYGLWNLPEAEPFPFRRGTPWPYCDDAFLGALEYHFWQEDPPGPLLLEWPDALALMERAGRVDQAFDLGPLTVETYALKTLPPAWRQYLGDRASPAQILRAFWNKPKLSGFAWRHPFTRVAVRPGGEPWRDDSGNVVLAFDPLWGGRAKAREFESLDDCRYLTPLPPEARDGQAEPEFRRDQREGPGRGPEDDPRPVRQEPGP